jgi:hypothetical protein
MEGPSTPNSIPSTNPALHIIYFSLKVKGFHFAGRWPRPKCCSASTAVEGPYTFNSACGAQYKPYAAMNLLCFSLCREVAKPQMLLSFQKGGILKSVPRSNPALHMELFAIYFAGRWPSPKYC